MDVERAHVLEHGFFGRWAAIDAPRGRVVARIHVAANHFGAVWPAEMDFHIARIAAIAHKVLDLLGAIKNLKKTTTNEPTGMRSGVCVKRTAGRPPRPRQMAQTSVLLPLPFGPMIMLRLGPGTKVTSA